MHPALAAKIDVAILDDHQLFRQGVAYILLQLPYVRGVVDMGTFEELSVYLESRQPDLLLLDLEMPGIDGIAGAQILLARYPTLRIVVLSMHTSAPFISRMMRLGVRSYMPKDVDKEQLSKVIEAIMITGHYYDDRITQALLVEHKPSGHNGAFSSVLLSPLTSREKEVLELICQGLTANEIAEKLFISVRTVEGHRHNLLEKTNTNNAVTLSLFAIKHGLVRLP